MMNRAKSVSIDTTSRMVESALAYRTEDGSRRPERKGIVQSGKARTRKDQELDLVVGRSMN